MFTKSLDFSEVCDGKHPKGSKHDCLFIFQGPLQKILFAKLSFLISCFISFFLPDSFSVTSRGFLLLHTCLTLMQYTVFHLISVPGAYLVLKLFKALLMRWMLMKKGGAYFKGTNHNLCFPPIINQFPPIIRN